METNSLPLISIVIIVLLSALFVVFVYVKIRKRKGLDEKAANYIRSHWMRIIDSLKSHPKNAVLDADKLLDYALAKHGFEGSLGEKLKKAGPRFNDLNAVWSAHKLRNRIAHELSDIDPEEAKRALKRFKSALNDLGAKL